MKSGKTSKASDFKRQGSMSSNNLQVSKKIGWSILSGLTVMFLFAYRTDETIASRRGEEDTVKPVWVITGTHPDYPPPKYVQGIGMAKAGKNPASDRQTADQNAFSEVARQISAQVSSEISVSKMEVMEGKVETLLDRTTAETKVRTSMTLSGLKIVERFYDSSEKICFSLGVLDRISASDPYRQSLLKHQKDYQEYLQSALQYMERGKVFQSLLSLREALDASYQFSEIFPSFQLFSGPAGFGELDFPTPPSSSAILDKLSEILSNLHLNMFNGDLQEFIAGKPLSTPLTVRLSMDSKDSKISAIPVEGFPIIFRFQTGEGELVPSYARSDKEGLASTSVTNIQLSSDQKYVVSVEVDFRDLLDMGNHGASWNDRIPSNPPTVYFTLVRKRVPPSEGVFVFIQDADPFRGRPAILRDVLIKHLSKAGFSPITEKDTSGINEDISNTSLENIPWKSMRQQLPKNTKIAILGEISISGFSTGYGMKVCSVNGLVKAMSLENGLTIAAKSFENVRGFGTTEAQAADDAFEKAAIEAAEPLISDLLAIYEPAGGNKSK